MVSPLGEGCNLMTGKVYVMSPTWVAVFVIVISIYEATLNNAPLSKDNVIGIGFPIKNLLLFNPVTIMRIPFEIVSLLVKLLYSLIGL